MMDMPLSSCFKNCDLIPPPPRGARCSKFSVIKLLLPIGTFASTALAHTSYSTSPFTLNSFYNEILGAKHPLPSRINSRCVCSSWTSVFESNHIITGTKWKSIECSKHAIQFPSLCCKNLHAVSCLFKSIH